MSQSSRRLVLDLKSNTLLSIEILFELKSSAILLPYVAGVSVSALRESVQILQLHSFGNFGVTDRLSEVAARALKRAAQWSKVAPNLENTSPVPCPASS